MCSREARTAGISSWARWCVAALLVLAGSGCFLGQWMFHEEELKPAYDIRQKTVLIVPFRDAKLWHGESALGHEMYRNLLHTLQECDGVQMISNSEIDAELASTLDDPDWCGYGRRTEADLVLTGQVTSFSYSEPKTIGMMRGTLRMSFQIWAVDANKIAYQAPVEVTYPPDLETGAIELSVDQSQDEFRREVFYRAAEQVKAKLCGEVVDAASRRNRR